MSEDTAAEPTGNPLPVVIYPTPRADKASADTVPPPAPPPQAQIAEAPPPVQYYRVDGVWGFWDHDHHFHPRPPTVVRGLTEPRHGSAAIHAEDGGRRAEFPRVEPKTQLAPHDTIRLSNPPPRGIVVQSPMPRDHNLTR
jgi:hypothetical protein